MGIVKKIEVESSIVCVWHITESLEQLSEYLSLSEESYNRLAKKKVEQHQKAFLAVRQMLRHMGIADHEVVYDTNGKPLLKNGDYISITHSFDYAAVAVSKENIGIDLEYKRDKVMRLQAKFCNKEELEALPLDQTLQIDYLTEIWSVKEALYKMCDSRSLSFARDITVEVSSKEARIEQGDFIAYFRYRTYNLDDYVFVVSNRKRNS